MMNINNNNLAALTSTMLAPPSEQNVFNLASAYSALNMPQIQGQAKTIDVPLQLQGQGGNGVPSHSVSHVELVSPQLRRDIIKGKDINLASLLIPNHNPDNDSGRHLVTASEIFTLKSTSVDPRLQRPLTITEFQMAFAIYKNVMVSAFPQREKELESYMRDVLEMSWRFGGTSFYEYHKAFSARAAALLQNHNIKIDWSIRDNNLFCSIFAGHKANACSVCNSLGHVTQFCPQTFKCASNGQNIPSANIVNPKGKQRSNQASMSKSTDRWGRPRVEFQGKEICNNFNSDRGCQLTNCSYLHICMACKNRGHHSVQGRCQGTGTNSVQQVTANFKAKSTPPPPAQPQAQAPKPKGTAATQ